MRAGLLRELRATHGISKLLVVIGSTIVVISIQGKSDGGEVVGRLLIRIAVLVLIALQLGCVIEGEDLYHRLEVAGEGDLGQCESLVDFSTEVQPIFKDAQCVLCHTDEGAAPPAGQLVLLEGVSYDQIVGVAAGGSPDKNLIEPGDEEASYLVDRIFARNGSKIMPAVGPPLDADQLSTIVCWVQQGAHLTVEDAENAQE